MVFPFEMTVFSNLQYIIVSCLPSVPQNSRSKKFEIHRETLLLESLFRKFADFALGTLKSDSSISIFLWILGNDCLYMLNAFMHNVAKWPNMAKLRCLHRHISKVCLAILQHASKS